MDIFWNRPLCTFSSNYDSSPLLIWTFVKSNLVPLVVFFCQGCLEVRNCPLSSIVESAFTYQSLLAPAPLHLRVPPWQAFSTGHILLVRIQVTVLQINKQDKKCLLALILIQNVVLDRAEIIQWPVKETFLLACMDRWCSVYKLSALTI